MSRKRIWIVIGAAIALAAAGCQPSPKPVSERERREAAQLGSEAEFAASVREWSRAEGLYARATRLHPEGTYFVGLGAVRVRLGNRSGAKEAYEAALRACEADAKQAPKDPEPWMRQVYLLALLGRVEDGRALLRKAEQRFPNERRVRAFVDGKQFEAMIASPEFKEKAL